MNKDLPELSVIVPFYNSERFIRQCILSLLAEDVSMQIIAVNDGSRDEGAKRISDLPIKIIDLPFNQGQAAAQNRGMSEAQGEFLCFFDSDDVLVKGGLKVRLEYLKANLDCNAVFGKIAAVIDEEGRPMGDYYGKFEQINSPLPGRIDWNSVMAGLQIPSQLWLYLFKASLIRRIGNLDESYRCAHDNDYVHRVLRNTAIHFIDTPVAFYRLHRGNQSRNFLNGSWKLSNLARAEKLLIDLQYRR